MTIMKKLNSSLLIFIIFLLFFLAVQNADQQVDSYSFVLDARNGEGLFHPHHLLYNVFRYALYQASISVDMDAMKVLSIANSLFGALSLAFIFMIVKNRTSSTLALTASVAVGFLYSFWYFSTSVEVNITSLMFLCLALYYLSAKPPNGKNTMAVFAFITAGILFHQLMVLAVIPILLYETHRHRSFALAVRYSMPSFVTGALIYLIIGIIEAPDKSIGGLYRWLTLYTHIGHWGKLQWTNFLTSLWGVAKSVFGGDNLRQVFYSDNLAASNVIYIVAAALSSLGFLLLLVSAFHHFSKKRNSFEWLLLSLAIIFVVFAFWWAPTDSGFWLYPVVMFLLFIIMAVSENYRMKRVLYLAVVLLVTINSFYEIVSSSVAKKSIARQGAAALSRLDLTPDDLLLTNLGRIPLALDYHYGIKVPSTGLAFLEEGDNDETVKEYHRLIGQNRGRVIIFENEISPEAHRRFLFERFSVEDYSNVYSRYIPLLIPLDSIAVYGKKVKIYQIRNNVTKGDGILSQ